jgi:hypothetical protein
MVSPDGAQLGGRRVLWPEMRRIGSFCGSAAGFSLTSPRKIVERIDNEKDMETLHQFSQKYSLG